jgi:AAA+ ATPase superfamily predicted ATPase
MNTPFVFGKIASDEYFTNRTVEISQLSSNFQSLVNTIIISPRRWGKSSLVKKAAEEASKIDKNIKFCFIDMYNVRSEEQFYQLLAQETLKVLSSKLDEILEISRSYLTRIIPTISFNPDPMNDFSISMDWEQIKKQPDEILDFAEKIAQSKKIKLMICIDEFQNISGFGQPVEFQKKLRSHWQKHQYVGYCLFGSKRHMLLDVFSSQSMPFYNFGHLLFLNKISEEHWIPFIVKRFQETGKKISPENAKMICAYAENHSFYVQQLAHLAWLNSENICNAEQVTRAYENLLLQLSFLYQSITDGLSNTQLSFLEAVLKGEEKFSSKEIIKTYNLGTSANVSRIKQALTEKEIIESVGNEIEFLDPMYKSWLSKHYFKLY